MAIAAVTPESAVAQTLVNSSAPPIVDQQAVAQQQQLSMVDSDGNAILVPAPRYQEAIQSGAKLETNAQAAQRDLQEKYGDAGVRTFAESAASGATAGISDQILAHFSDDKGYDLAARRTANPYSALAGQVAGTTGALIAGGGLVGAVEKGAVGLLGAGAEAAGAVGAAGEAAEGVGTLAKLGGLAARGATEGAYLGAQNATSENALGNPEDFGELLFSQVGMNALLGGALSPLADVGLSAIGKGLSKAGDVTGSLVDNLKPFLPGTTQTVDALTGEALGGTKAAIARKVNDIYASAAQLNPFSTVSKEDLVTALNNPEGRALLNTPEMRQELEEFAKQAPTVLSDFKSDLLSANSEVRQEMKDYTRSLAQGVKEDSADAAAQLFKVRESIANVQREAQQKLNAQLSIDTTPATGLLTDVNDHVQDAIKKLSNNELVGKSYAQPIQQALDTAANLAPETQGGEILALRQFRHDVGEIAYPDNYKMLSRADQNAIQEVRSLYENINGVLRDPARVGAETANLLKISDAEYSNFTGLNNVFGKITQNNAIQSNGRTSLVDSVTKTTKNVLNAEKNSVLVDTLNRASAIKDAAGQSIVKDDLIQGLKDLLTQKETAASVKTDVKDFLTSPGAKDYDSLVAKAQEITGQTSEAQSRLSQLSGVKQNVTGLGDASAFDKALAVQRGTGAIDEAQAQKLGTLKNLSSALGEREPFLSSGAKEIAEATRGHGEHGISLTGLIGKVANPVSYLRAVDIAKQAVAKLQSEVVGSAIRAVTDAAKPVVIRAAILKADDYKQERDNLQRMQNNIPNQLSGSGNPILAMIPSQATPSLLKTGGAAVTYLNSQLPKPPDSTIGPMGDIYKDWKPTNAQMQEYAEKKAVVQDPRVAMKALADGSITSNQVDALKTVYPQLYGQVSQAMMQLADKMQGSGISWSRNLALMKWFGPGTDTSITTSSDAMKQMQSVYPESQPQGGQQGGQAPQPKVSSVGLRNLNIADRASTGLESTLTRGS